MTLYPRFLLTFSKNKYNNTKFCNEEFLRVAWVDKRRTRCTQEKWNVVGYAESTERGDLIRNAYLKFCEIQAMVYTTSRCVCALGVFFNVEEWTAVERSHLLWDTISWKYYCELAHDTLTIITRGFPLSWKNELRSRWSFECFPFFYYTDFLQQFMRGLCVWIENWHVWRNIPRKQKTIG